MQKFLNHLLNRNVSTARVDDMASNHAVTALGYRMNRMLALHATLPPPQHQQFSTLSNPIQKPANS